MNVAELTRVANEFGTSLGKHLAFTGAELKKEDFRKAPDAVVYMSQMQMGMTMYQTAAKALFDAVGRTTDEAVDAAVNQQAAAQGFKPEVVK